MFRRSLITILAAGLFSVPIGVAHADYDLSDSASGYATANAEYNAARRNYDDTCGKAVRVRQAAMKQAELSPQYQSMVRQVDNAYKMYSSAREQAGDTLGKNSPQYAQLIAQRDATQVQIEALRSEGNTDIKLINDLYNTKAKYTSQIKKLEDTNMSQIAGNQLYSNWQESCKQLENFKQQVKLDIDKLPDVQSAMQGIAQAQQTMDQAGIKLAGSEAAYRATIVEASADFYLQNRYGAAWGAAANGYNGGGYWSGGRWYRY